MYFPNDSVTHLFVVNVRPSPVGQDSLPTLPSPTHAVNVTVWHLAEDYPHLLVDAVASLEARRRFPASVHVAQEVLPALDKTYSTPLWFIDWCPSELAQEGVWPYQDHAQVLDHVADWSAMEARDVFNGREHSQGKDCNPYILDAALAANGERSGNFVGLGRWRERPVHHVPSAPYAGRWVQWLTPTH